MPKQFYWRFLTNKKILAIWIYEIDPWCKHVLSKMSQLHGACDDPKSGVQLSNGLGTGLRRWRSVVRISGKAEIFFLLIHTSIQMRKGAPSIFVKLNNYN